MKTQCLSTKCKKCNFEVFAINLKELQKEIDRHDKVFHKNNGK